MNQAMFAVDLQCRRLRSTEPEDEDFIFRFWYDLQFLIVILRRMRRVAELASRVPAVADEISKAKNEFDASLPMLQTMRNVGEHIDDYALDDDRRRHKAVNRKMLQVGSWDGTTYDWLGTKLNIDDARAAAMTLLLASRKALDQFTKIRRIECDSEKETG